ncbi:MAG: hypothetical protein PHU85_15330 [Phycisphaerae bacterium]|nr:hypothetical protein [Phycisphaerae bacterium]
MPSTRRLGRSRGSGTTRVAAGQRGQACSAGGQMAIGAGGLVDGSVVRVGK